MKPTSKTTYKIIRLALEKKSFRQRELQRGTGVSIGMVNYIIRWLLEHNYAVRSKEGYRIVAFGGLLSLFAVYRRMEPLKIYSGDVELSRKNLFELIKEKKAVLCLTTALQQYDNYFRDPRIIVYADENFVKELSGLRGGYTHVEVYVDDLKCKDDIITTKGVMMTNKIRTAIDLMCSNYAYASEHLVRRIGGL